MADTKVLIVDDEETFVRMVKLTLEDSGQFEVKNDRDYEAGDLLKCASCGKESLYGEMLEIATAEGIEAPEIGIEVRDRTQVHHPGHDG